MQTLCFSHILSISSKNVWSSGLEDISERKKNHRNILVGQSLLLNL